MALHRLTHITIGVPNVEETIRFYREFGLSETAPGRLATLDGGEQLIVEESPARSLREIGFGVEDAADLNRIAGQLADIGVSSDRRADLLTCTEPGSGVSIAVRVADHIVSAPAPPISLNSPGHPTRSNERSPALALGSQPLRPRKLSHVVLGSPEFITSTDFFIDGIGMKVSDRIGVGAFLRCATDHHNVLVQAAPVTFMHHAAWEVNSPDDILRGGAHMIQQFPGCHMWGMGRHYLGSNLFWYLKDPAGNFAEYTTDLDYISDEAEWEPKDLGMEPEALVAWGPPPPGPFLFPEDLPQLMEAAGV